MKKGILLIAFLSITALVLAQPGVGTISGKVAGNDGKSSQSATVILLKLKDSSMVKTVLTDANGQYDFNRIKEGRFFILITVPGFQPFRTTAIIIDSTHQPVKIPMITLVPAVKNLTGVTVVTTRPFVERKIDRLLINVASSPLNAGQSAFDVLEKSPGVTIDENDNITLAGKQGVLIYIDGKPNYLAGRDLTNYLKGLPASQLDQIEIMTQPSARYDAAGDAGIINFKTKKNTANGFNGSLSTAAIFSYYFKTRNSLVFTWKKNKWNIMTNYSYSSIRNFSNQHNERTYRNDEFTPPNRYFVQDARVISNQYPNNIKTTIDFRASKNTTLGMIFTSTFSHNGQSTGGLINTSDSLHQLTQITNYVTRSGSKVSNPGINLNWQQKLAKGKEITADADYIYYHNPSRQSTNNYSTNGAGMQLDPFLLKNDIGLNINIYSFKTDYSQPLPRNAKFEAGVKSSYVSTDNNVHYEVFNAGQNQWQNDTGRTNHFLYKENINAAYVNFSKEFNKKWSLQTGLRMEQTNSTGNEMVKNNIFHKHDVKLFPTVFLSYKPDDKNTITADYGRRINRPTYNFLNPFQTVIDQFTFQQGNPALKPILSDNIDASYDYKGQFNVTLSYFYLHGIFSPMMNLIKQNNNYVLLQMPVNVSSRRTLMMNTSFQKSIRKWWSSSINVLLLNHRFNDLLDSEMVTSKINVFIINVSNQFPLKKGWTLELSGIYRSKRMEGFPVFAIPSGTVSAGVTKKFKTSSLTLNFNDPFRLLKGGIFSDRSTFSFHNHNQNENRNITLTFNYRFGKNMQQQNKRNNGSAQDEQSRVIMQ